MKGAFPAENVTASFIPGVSEYVNNLTKNESMLSFLCHLREDLLLFALRTTFHQRHLFNWKLKILNNHYFRNKKLKW